VSELPEVPPNLEQPERRKTRKSLSRRSGQLGSLNLCAKLDGALPPAIAGAVLTVAALSAADTQTSPNSPVISVEALTSAAERLPTVPQFPSGLMPISERGILPCATSSPPSTEVRPVPRRRFQKGRVYRRGKKWVGSYRDNEVNPQTGERMRRTVTFDESVTSERAARRELQTYLDRVNLDPPSPRRGGRTVSELIEEWKETIAPNRKDGGLRATLSHIRAHILPLLGPTPLRELNLRACQRFVTAVGQSVNRKKTAENVYGSLSSILNAGRKWGYAIPKVGREDIEFPANRKPKPPAFFFDAETAARVINAATYPFRLMFLIAALCYLRIGEVTALKVSSLDFKRKVIHIDAALDYATRKEITTKSDKSCASVPMPELLERHLKDWLENRYTPNPEGYLFLNSKNRPYLSDNVIKYGVHRAMAKLGIPRPKGVRVGVHCFRHGASSELLDLGIPINVVTRLMRHSDSKTTLNNYAHSVHDAERVASERLSKKIEERIAQLESGSEMESAPLQTV
jgi:integrase